MFNNKENDYSLKHNNLHEENIYIKKSLLGKKKIVSPSVKSRRRMINIENDNDIRLTNPSQFREIIEQKNKSEIDSTSSKSILRTTSQSIESSFQNCEKEFFTYSPTLISSKDFCGDILIQNNSTPSLSLLPLDVLSSSLKSLSPVLSPIKKHISCTPSRIAFAHSTPKLPPIPSSVCK
jgi:hypothetical protein